jgi:hypothetical protein
MKRPTKKPRHSKRTAAKKAMPANRTELGKFRPGFSGNPNGRPAIAAEVAELAQQHGPEAIEKAVHIMRHAKDPRVALAAVELLLNRGFGRPLQALAGPNGQPLPLINLVIGEGRAITDADEAGRIYQEILGRPDVDLEGLRFDAPEPTQLTAPADAAAVAALAEVAGEQS